MIAIAHAQGGRTMEDLHASFMKFVAELKTMPIAVQTQAANEQHYEVPAEFYQLCLGPWLKYSSCLYTPETKTLQARPRHRLNG
jgi:cyclopropane-fatty-acyl-phospholipid synthase